MKRIFVGNLPYSVRDDELRDLFSEFGTVHDFMVVMERGTGRSRGFGFVEMDDAPATEAIEKMHGREVGGRTLQVNEARSKESSDRRGGFRS